ncbi:MAG: hypothetical protein RMA76_33875 [Deltaproteobacteria bacterium]
MKRRAAFLLTSMMALALGACASFQPGSTPNLNYEGPVATGSKLYKHQSGRTTNATPSKVRVLTAWELGTAGSPTVGRALSRPGIQ